MKHVIISLESGRVESIGPLLLIKANPIQEETMFGNKLPEALHKESPNTKNFVFKISMDLIEAFIKALEDSKADKKFWDPNMDDYVLEDIIDFEGKQVSAYKHYSFRLNENPIPKDILPDFYEPVAITPKVPRTIKKKTIGNINDYIKSGTSSFDYMLRDYDNSQKVFAYPVLVTEKFSRVINRCHFSQFRKEGVYLANDIIQPEKNSPNYLKHSLLCTAYNRFFTTYSIQEEVRIWYRFFSKEACHLLYNLFD